MYHQFSLSGSQSRLIKGAAHTSPTASNPIGRALQASIFLTLVLGSLFSPCLASPSCVPSTQTPEDQTALIDQAISDRFEGVPAGAALKKRPTDVKIYEYDREPIKDREPFLLVHGLRGEYYPYFRWNKVADKLKKNPDFNRRYKIYLARYSTLDRLDEVVPKFKNAIASLYLAGKRKPISVMALSMGGNVSYEAIQDPDTDNKVRMLFTMGTPFHGSPLFTKEWMSYTVYKRLSWPWSRVDHNLAFKLYFSKNPNLQKDLTWDNADQAIPEVGKFWSRIPFGPSGRLSIADTMNYRLAKLNQEGKSKHKLITYGGYISNPYMVQGAKRRYLERAFMYPYFLMSSTFPAHFAREHPVLGFLNREITNVQVSKDLIKQSGTPFVYALNDGITPVSSAIFLPDDDKNLPVIAREQELEKLRDRLDVGLARCFKNVDHLTFIDGVRPMNKIRALVNPLVRDELNPKEGQKEIFDWILGDILKSDAVSGRLVEKTDTEKNKN